MTKLNYQIIAKHYRKNHSYQFSRQRIKNTMALLQQAVPGSDGMKWQSFLLISLS
ncbi:hypothetical protein [Moritella sp.]|uniref:hypothetical protein n=1 Tax=Moritella sp. TaxID=78556 RepID=UPI001DAF45FD|nr:hypothetical protein [Moritella sp.]MCJ8351206.1 hypothetical protein [Moritella sp.]NQZ41488.1 hypothetical protein [Moritella sp.]